MLSIENPPPDPPLPPCPSDSIISRLRITDERDSDKVIDLLKSGLDDKNPELPNFSLRDYVFSTRNQDLKANWPFSQKNLQLCLKRGVKDLLPPFQSLDSVKNQLLKKNESKTRLIDCENTLVSNLDGNPSRRNDHVPTICCDDDDDDDDDDRCIEKPDEVCVKITQEIPCSELETDSAFEAIAEKPRAIKNHNTAHRAAKKCRLTERLANASDPSSNGDNSSNCGTFSETMTSKLCPVCKTFSSPSNTTLNAHIDQCLSVESPIKWTAENTTKVENTTKAENTAKVVKHRIKPRKIRLMVDIYATASMCTLEELDRRNGTTWATNTAAAALPAQENVMRAEEKRERAVLPINVEDTGDEGAVYIDANGTKVRILSKFNDSTQARLEPQKLSEGGKRSKFLSGKKKKHYAEKHKKFLKIANKSKKICSSKPNGSSKVVGGIERRHHVAEENFENSKAQLQQIKHGELGNIRKWVPSKRTNLSKKSKDKRSLQLSGYDLRQDLGLESDPRSSLGFLPETSNSSECPPSSPENSKKMDDSLNELSDQTPRRKRTGISSIVSPFHTKQLRNDSRENISSSCNKEIEVNAGLIKVRGSSRDVLTESSRRVHAISSKSSKHSSIRKKFLSVKQPSSMPGSKCKSIRKSSVPKKVRKDWMTEFDEQLEARPSEPVEHDQTGIPSTERVPKIRKKGRSKGFSRREEETLALESSYLASRNFGVNVKDKINPSERHDGDSSPEKGSNVMSKQSEPEFPKLSSPSCTRPRTLRSVGVFKGSFYGDTDPSFIDEEEMFCTEEAGGNDVVISHNTTHIEEELDPRERQEKYFTEVDQIPIPGPPGSFLPSPRGMSSENIQESSSLTSNQIQYSEGIRDMVDKDSSDSPVSATSTVSNTAMVQNDPNSSGQLSLGPRVVQGTIGHPSSTEVNMILPDKGIRSFNGDDQPCCCVRKEGISLNYQESQLRRRRNMTSVPLPAIGKQMSCDLNRGTLDMDSKEAVAPVHESGITSASNPVLRLMGKNLMVVNKESQRDVPRDSSNPRGGILYGDLNFHNQLVHHGPFIVGQNRNNNVNGKGYDVHSFPGTTPREIGAMFPRTDIGGGGGFVASMDPRESKSGYVPDNMWAKYNMENFHAPPNIRHFNAHSSSAKEIIVIDDADDSPEIEANNNLRGRQVVNPFYSGSGPMLQNGSFEMMASLRGGGNGSSPLKWNCSSNPSSLMASSSSTGHLRSSLYYSPNFT